LEMCLQTTASQQVKIGGRDRQSERKDDTRKQKKKKL